MTEDEKLTHILKGIQDKNNGETIEFVIPKKASRIIVAYQSLREDLLFCRNVIELLKDKEFDNTQKMSLYYSFIAIYGKCFTNASSSKSPNLSISDFGLSLSKYEVLHKKLMDMRHNYISHRGISEDDLGVGVYSINKKTLNQRIEVKEIRRININKYDEIIDLIDFLIKITEEKYKSAALRVKDYLLKLSPEELIELMITLP